MTKKSRALPPSPDRSVAASENSGNIPKQPNRPPDYQEDFDNPPEYHEDPIHPSQFHDDDLFEYPTDDGPEYDDNNNHEQVLVPFLQITDVHREHRIKFNSAAFGTTFEGGAMANRRAKNSRMMPKHEYENHINVLRYWNVKDGHTDPVTGKHVSQAEFRRRHSKNWYRLARVYKVTTSISANGTVVERLKRLDDESCEWKLVVHEENVFDAILECHRTVGHKKVAATRNQASQKYWNVTEELCKTFVSCCPECCHEAPKAKKLLGARNPIYSAQFRDRYQADLVDYRSNPKPDVNGIEMKWLLVVKDHFTKFTMLRPIARKEAKLVANELSVTFGVLGYPLIFHTDNGKEFTADLVLSLVKEWNPSCKTVTGRRRTPRDQGSVERANASIKAVIAKLEQEQRNKGNNDPNWVQLLPSAMSAINCSIVDGLGQQSAYSHVYGMEYSLPLFGAR